MILRIDFPPQDPKYRGGTLVKWHKSPGEAIRFGDDLFDIAIDRVVRLGHTKRATLLAQSSRKLSRLKNERSERTPKGTVIVRITSAEPVAHMRQLFVEEGQGVVVGETVALASSADDEPWAHEIDLSSSVPLRSVLNIVDQAE